MLLAFIHHSLDMTGHGVCIDCKSNFFQESVRPNCPNCRLRIRDRDAHPLFLELVDSKVAFVLSLVEGLDRMDHETSLLNVKKAGQGLTKVVHLEDTAESSAMVTMRLSSFYFSFLIPFFLVILLLDYTYQGYRRFQRTYHSSLYQSTSSDTPNHRLTGAFSGKPSGNRKFTGSTENG